MDGQCHRQLTNLQQSQLKSLNREILQACHSYNKVPEPFNSHSNKSHTFNNNLNSATASNNLLVPAQNGTFHNNNDSRPVSPSSIRQQQSIKQSPSLIHRRAHNSPLELRSMSNIKKTLDAQSEMLAAGVIGIDFVKRDEASKAVTKASEVFKLIKELECEERRERQQENARPVEQSQQAPSPLATSSRDPDAGARNSNAGANCFLTPQTQRRHLASSLSASQSTLANAAKPRRALMTPSQFLSEPSLSPTSSCGHAPSKPAAHLTSTTLLATPPRGSQRLEPASNSQRQGALRATPSRLFAATNPSSEPTVCSECNLLIAGAYAQIGLRNFHSKCLACATCGASLNNDVGHFEVNDKFYCQLHVGQAEANLTAKTIAASCANRQQPTRPSFQPRQAQNTPQGGHSLAAANYTKLQCNYTSPSLTCGERENADLKPKSPPAQQSRRPPPTCKLCSSLIRGAYVTAGQQCWCKRCSVKVFKCGQCLKSLLDCQFVDTNAVGAESAFYCKQCHDELFAVDCAKCKTKIESDCVKALGASWHPNCFACAACKQQFKNCNFYLEDGRPYCERDWHELFTVKCHACALPIKVGDKCVEALHRNYHQDCFRCFKCGSLVDSNGLFYCKNGEPLCRAQCQGAF